MEGWQDSVANLVGMAHRHPQTTYAILQKSLQQEWAFVQRINPDIGMDFQGVENAMWVIFLPTLFLGSTAQILERTITCLLVKQAGIALRTKGGNWTASCMITGHLVAELCGTAEFRSGDHSLLMGEERGDISWRHAEEAHTVLGEARAAVSKT